MSEVSITGNNPPGGVVSIGGATASACEANERREPITVFEVITEQIVRHEQAIVRLTKLRDEASLALLGLPINTLRNFAYPDTHY